MVKNKGKIAQIEGLTGKSTTFGELLQNSVRLALNMQEKGIEYGDIISICSNDNEDVPLTFIASLFLGVTVSALEPSFGLDDLINSLKQICPKMIFVEPKILEKIVEALTSNGLDCRIVVFGATERHTTFSDMIRPVDCENDFRPVPVTSLLETAYIVFTSGTTGIPKTIRHNHHSVQYQYFSLIQKNFCWDMLLHYSTPFWTLYTQFLGITIILGTTRVFYPTFYENYWDFVKYKITTAFFSVTEISTLCIHQRPKNLNLRGLKILIGGNVVHRNHLERIRTVFYDADLYVCYGFTEIPGTLTSFACKKTDWELKSVNPTSVGTGFPGISYKVVDCVTEEILGPNKVGELRVKAQFPLGGYYKSHPISLWDSYGWLKTGDMVYYNDDRCFYVIDRVKHMFKYKDYHVVPRVLEEILESHPAVQRAAVVGVPNEEDGHHPLGFVVLKSSVEAVTSRILEDFVEQRVADYLRLRAGVKIVDKFPTTRTGKVRKWLLQERL
ncbi:hypothetical protein RI129_011076 [Pyrocoelia pectoralis]|uniref:Uncharacterized protein n=1 Tax=Pyrocoelia pectoralis TaxID=417401 RepID=A0AAN7ZA70_9COLE